MIGKRLQDVLDSFMSRMRAQARSLVRAGAPDMKCAWPSATTIPGVGVEYVCECCGFRWGGKNGVDAAGRKYERNAKGEWIRVYG